MRGGIAASRFRDYRKSPNPESDLSFLDAFKKADGYDTAANEPNAIGTWRDDMDAASSDLSEWVNLAAGWQIGEHTTAQLQAAEAKVNAALAKARGDVAKVVAGRELIAIFAAHRSTMRRRCCISGRSGVWYGRPGFGTWRPS